MKRISREHTTYLFGRDVSPVARITSGESVLFETWDAQHGRIQSHDDALTVAPPPELVNPATGPIFVDGAEPGDTLAVHILSIELGERGQSRLRAGGGVITDLLNPPAARLIPVDSGVAHFNESLSFPVRPMVGVVGTAPGGEGVHTFHPGPHGGNLDINDIQAGATVYLPVGVSGGLLGIGDVHASMGDGELTGGGIDIPAEVVVRVEVCKGIGWVRPVVETKEVWAACANAPTLEGAVRQATWDLVSILARQLEISREEAFILIGCAGDARIGQAAQLGVDMTAYVRISKGILPKAY